MLALVQTIPRNWVTLKLCTLQVKLPEDFKHEGVANLHAHTTAAQGSLAHATIIFVLGG